MKLGIGSYTFPWAVGVKGYARAVAMNERDLLDVADRSHIRVLQIGDNLPLHTFHIAGLEDFAAAAKNRNVEIQAGARRLVTERVAQYVDVARTLGARVIHFAIDDGEIRPDREAVIATLRECAPMLNGLILAIENCERFEAATLRDIIETVGDERIGVCLDTANSLGAGEGIEAVTATLAPVAVNVHLKDFAIERAPHSMGFNVVGRPAGAGMLNVPALLDALAPYERCDTAILELWTPPEARIEETVAKEARWAEESLKYLRPFFG